MNQLEIGEIIKWYEPYADGYITKDSGLGLILKINKRDLGFTEGPYTNYTVYRNKHQDTMNFDVGELEKIQN